MYCNELNFAKNSNVKRENVFSRPFVCSREKFVRIENIQKWKRWNLVWSSRAKITSNIDI